MAIKYSHCTCNDKYSLLQWILLTVITFFFIYSLDFTFTPTYVSRLISYIGILFIIIHLFKIDSSIVLKSSFILILSIYFFYFAWVSIITIATHFRDVSMFNNVVLLFVQVFIAAIFMTNYIGGRNNSLSSIIRVIQLCIVIQGIFIIISFLSVDFRLFTLDYIPQLGSLDPLHPFRVRGLTHGGGAGLSAIQGTGLLFAVHSYYYNRKYKQIGFNTIYSALSITILGISILLTGFTGFLIIPFIGLFIFYHRYKELRFSLLSMLSFILLLSIVTIGIFTFPYIYDISVSQDYLVETNALERAVRRATSQINIDKGILTSVKAESLLISQVFFPSDTYTFIFGNPTTYSVERIPSDVGYVRRIFAVGLIGTFLTYLLFISMMVILIRKADNYLEKAMLLLLTIWFLMLELKEPFLLDFRFAAIYTLLFFQKVKLLKVS